MKLFVMAVLPGLVCETIMKRTMKRSISINQLAHNSDSKVQFAKIFSSLGWPLSANLKKVHSTHKFIIMGM